MKPVINDSNFRDIKSLLDTFDEITFNPAGELVATVETTVPVFGDIVVSFLPLECHLMIFPVGTGPSEEFFSGTVQWDHWSEDWRSLQPLVLEALRNAVINSL